MKTKLNNVLVPATAASLLMLGSCGPEEPVATDESTDLLIGDWELTQVDGEDRGGEYDGYSYSFGFSFERDGDFIICNGYENFNDPSLNYEDCYDGDWNWISVGQELALSWEDDTDQVPVTYEVDFEITKLTATELEGTWIIEDVDGNDSYELVFKKR